jgi:hypothetical protein
MVSDVDALINHLFVQNSFNKDPKEARDPEFDKLYQMYGNNLISESNNKYFFKLLQIFGFNNTPLASLLDKSKMKEELINTIKSKIYPKDDIFEHFLIVNSID